MDPFWRIALLAVVQGITEFLPVSSSGHLVILSALLTPAGEPRADVTDLNIVLHLGTLLSIAVFYWRRILALVGEDRRAIGLLLVGTLPALALGLPLKLFAEAWLENPLLAGCLLPVTGLILLYSRRVDRAEGNYTELTWLRAILVGCAQAVAILPGISRSGATITAGLACGLSRKSAATFSFLLALPAIAAAGLLEICELTLHGDEFSTPLPYLAVGMAISFAVGMVALLWLVRWLEQGKLWWFAAWCFLVGGGIIVWQSFPLPTGT